MGVDPATATGTDEIIAKLTAEAKKTYRNRQAPLTAIEAVRGSVGTSLDDGLALENKLANIAKATIESRALVHAFFAERDTRKVPGLPATTKAKPVKKAAIVGSGTMGGGIAICFANAGIPVTLFDVNQEALDRGLAVVDKTYASMVKRGRLSAGDKARRMAPIRGGLDYGEARDADLIIEAVFENMALKKQIFAALDKVAKPGAVLATNTST